MTTADNTRLTPTNAPNIDPHAVTISGIVLNPTYTPDQPPASLQNQPTDIPAPGQYPYTRGLFPEGYRTRLWTMRQFAGFGSADDTNRRFKYILNAGRTTQTKSHTCPSPRGRFPEGYRTRLWTMRQFAGFGSADDTNRRFKYILNAGRTTKTKSNTGLSTAFDLPTLMGRDSDDTLSLGEVGRCGVAIDTIEDMHRLYADIPIDQVTVSQTINGPAAVIWAMYLAMAKQRGIPWSSLGGTLQNDILKEFHSQNEFIYPPEASTKLVVDTIEFQSQHLPKWNSVSISGYHIREAGSSATQELAFTLRDGMEYVEACLIRGLDIEQFAPRLSFFFNAHNEFFEEIAKLRAARRIWARMMKDRYGAKNERSWFMKTHVQTAGCSLTEQQPLNNIVRVAYQAMAAVLGGCQSLHTDSMDETLGLPTEQAVTVALRTQQILAHETGVTRTADPLGGSWFVESLTDTVESEALDYIAEIDAMGRGPWKPEHATTSAIDDGGVVRGIHKGYFRRQIAEASYRFSEECENHDRIIVGVNEYTDKDEGRPIEILQIGHEVESDQIAQLTEFKKRRDKDAANRALDTIRESARNNENVMPALVEGALANCTLGEMVQAMADVYGRYTGGPEW